MKYIGYIILGILIIICISGNKEIMVKKYPRKILFLSDILMVIQTFIVLGGNGEIVLSIPYCLGYFSTGLLSLIFLAVYIRYYNKITGNTNE